MREDRPFCPAWSVKEDDIAIREARVAKKVICGSRLPRDVASISDLVPKTLAARSYSAYSVANLYQAETSLALEKLSDQYDLKVVEVERLSKENEDLAGAVATLNNDLEKFRRKTEKAAAKEAKEAKNKLATAVAKAKVEAIQEYKASEAFEVDVGLAGINSFAEGYYFVKDFVAEKDPGFDFLGLRHFDRPEEEEEEAAAVGEAGGEGCSSPVDEVGDQGGERVIPATPGRDIMFEPDSGATVNLGELP